MSTHLLDGILDSSVGLMVPFLWAALGEVIIERSGMINAGIEGVMLFGAATAALTDKLTHSSSMALAAAVPVGLLCGAFLALAYVWRAADQIVAGLMFMLLAAGGTQLVYDQFLRSAPPAKLLGNVGIPGLDDIPVLGKALFSQNWLFYAAIIAAILVAVILRHTWFGLALDAVGGRPEAANAAGLNVYALRSVALIVGCGISAVGGASIIVTQSGTFLPNVTNGQGFIALAVVVLAGFSPLWLIAGAALFGVSTSLQFQMQNVSWGAHVPTEVWLAVPYLLTIVVLASTGARQRVPAALGVLYRRPERRRVSKPSPELDNLATSSRGIGENK